MFDFLYWYRKDSSGTAWKWMMIRYRKRFYDTADGKMDSCTHVNIPEYCSLVRGHQGPHSFLIKCNSLAEPSWLKWRLTENEIQIYSLSLCLYGLHRKSLLLWNKFWNYPRVTPPPTQPWHLEVASGIGD